MEAQLSNPHSAIASGVSPKASSALRQRPKLDALSWFALLVFSGYLVASVLA